MIMEGTMMLPASLDKGPTCDGILDRDGRLYPAAYQARVCRSGRTPTSNS
jgi:hypothetical protein